MPINNHLIKECNCTSYILIVLPCKGYKNKVSQLTCFLRQQFTIRIIAYMGTVAITILECLKYRLNHNIFSDMAQNAIFTSLQFRKYWCICFENNAVDPMSMAKLEQNVRGAELTIKLNSTKIQPINTTKNHNVNFESK